MATELNFSIKKGRTCTIQVPITGITIWTGIIAKLFASKEMEQSASDIIIVGTIDTPSNTASFSFAGTDTENLDIQTSLYYDVDLYKADGSYIKTCTKGLLHIAASVKIDPRT